jgi:hypothetical protein
MEMSYTVDVNAKPDQQMADIAKGQHQYYKDNYVPFENQMIAGATGDMKPRINSVLSQLGQQQNNLTNIGLRNMSRYGMAVDPRAMGGMGRQVQLSNAAQSTAAHNSLAQGLYDQNLGTLGSLASIGRGLSDQATDGIGAAMQNQSARDAQYSQALQAYRTANAQYNSSPFTLFGLL